MLGPPFVRPDDPTGVVIAQPACVEHGFYPWRGTPRSCSSAAGASIQRKTGSYPLRGRRQRPALRRAFFAALHHALDHHFSSQILSNEPQHPFVSNRLTDPVHQDVVVNAVEGRRNDALKELKTAQEELHQSRQQQGLELSDEQKAQLRALAEDLPKLWSSQTTSAQDRKRMLRLVIKDITNYHGKLVLFTTGSLMANLQHVGWNRQSHTGSRWVRKKKSSPESG